MLGPPGTVSHGPLDHAKPEVPGPPGLGPCGCCGRPPAPSRSQRESGSTPGDFPGVLWGRAGAGGQAGRPWARGAWVLIQDYLSASLLVRGATRGPRAPRMPSLSVLTPEGLTDASSPTSLSPQPLLLISPNQQRFNAFRARPGPRRRRPGTQCARAVAGASPRQHGRQYWVQILPLLPVLRENAPSAPPGKPLPLPAGTLALTCPGDCAGASASTSVLSPVLGQGAQEGRPWGPGPGRRAQ